MNAHHTLTPQSTIEPAPRAFVILHGPLAPKGCVVTLGSRQAVRLIGRVRVFQSLDAAITAIMARDVLSDDVIVCMASCFGAHAHMDISKALEAAGLVRAILLTDQTLTEPSSHMVIANTYSHSAKPLEALCEGQLITIDIPARKILPFVEEAPIALTPEAGQDSGQDSRQDLSATKEKKSFQSLEKFNRLVSSPDHSPSNKA